jgi:predicted transcriptional regulator
MASKNSPVIALMSIYPEFARRILAGKKKVEFRRTPFRKEVTHVLIYATAPSHDVVGYFEVDGVDLGRPEDIWEKYKHVSGLNEDRFKSYFRGTRTAVAIRVGRVVPLATPLPLATLSSSLQPPQSFRYLTRSMAHRLGIWTSLSPRQSYPAL